MSLHQIEPAVPNKYLIERLELLLEQAKEGEVQSCVIMKMFKTGNVSTLWSMAGHQNPTQFLGEFEYFKAVFIEWMRSVYDELGMGGKPLEGSTDPYAS